jgi:hypothetical protein
VRIDHQEVRKMLGTLVMFAMLVALGLALLIAIPLLLLKVAFGLVFLPFRILGAVLRGVASVLAGVGGVAAAVLGAAFAVGGVLLGLVLLPLLPLLPLLFMGLVLWALLRATRRPATVRLVS